MIGKYRRYGRIRDYLNEHHFLGSTAPEGWSFCSCGAKTGPTVTFERQRQWHRAHRKQIEEMKILAGRQQ